MTSRMYPRSSLSPLRTVRICSSVVDGFRLFPQMKDHQPDVMVPATTLELHPWYTLKLEGSMSLEPILLSLFASSFFKSHRQLAGSNTQETHPAGQTAQVFHIRLRRSGNQTSVSKVRVTFALLLSECSETKIHEPSLYTNHTIQIGRSSCIVTA